MVRIRYMNVLVINFKIHKLLQIKIDTMIIIEIKLKFSMNIEVPIVFLLKPSCLFVIEEILYSIMEAPNKEDRASPYISVPNS